MTLTCTKCKDTKPVSEFHKARNRKSGYHTWCKLCVSIDSKRRYIAGPEDFAEATRRWAHKNRFTASLVNSRSSVRKSGHVPCGATVEELRASFTGKCVICGVPELELNRKLCMDHDHKTGEFRGWLCQKCNRAIGLLGDSEELLINALHHLMSSNSNSNRKVF